MSLSTAFLDEIRARTSLSALIGASIKVEKAGREHKACCPFHGEKTPSFTINDDKGFYHCFGCGAHGDAIRWLTDHAGMDFIDAVKDLAAAAGLDLPTQTPEQAERARAVENIHDVLERAGAWYAAELGTTPSAMDMLLDRGVSVASISKFGLGLAPSRRSVALCGAGADRLEASGLLLEGDDGLLRDRFRARLMIPVHDARGRCVGFGARATTDRQDAKYLNSPAADHFDKGRLLFNLHRASPAARTAKRLVLVEGYFDVIALDAAGVGEAVAPMGTALTVDQISRAWRVVYEPILLMDGDAAGRKAAARACETALPAVGPGGSLAVAMLPDGIDPDELLRLAVEDGGGREGLEAILSAAVPLSQFVWEAALATPWAVTPEGKANLWRRLAGLAGTIVDVETRAQYLSDWRARFDAHFPPPPPGLVEEDMLPNGSVEASLTDQGPGVQALLKRVAAAWLDRQRDRLPDTEKAIGGWAFGIGRRVAAGLFERDAGWAVVQEALDRCAKADAAAIAKSFDAGCVKEFDCAGMLLDMRCASFQRTDMGNAERWFARYGRDYLYTTAKGWLGWDGRRYRVLNQEKDVTPAEVMASVFETVRGIQREAGFVRDTGVDRPDEPFTEKMPTSLAHHWEMHVETGEHEDAMDTFVQSGSKVVQLSALIGRWGRASEASGRIGCIAGLAKRWCTVELSQFDTDPMLLNCLNGTLRFGRPQDGEPARVELKPHDRKDMLTKLTACDYDPEAEAVEWEKFVLWAQPKDARRRYLQQWMGYNLTGDTGEQIFHIWWGPTAANGKSTFGNACRDAIGDYGDIINIETFLDEGGKKRGDAATPDLVRLPGVRFLTSGEVPVGAKINEPLINTVTGGDGMNVRDNFRSFFRFFPIFKWTLWCNEKPDIPRGTEGIWRRVKVVLWESHLEPHQRDRLLPDKLKREYAGILAWQVRGLLDWMNNGFIEPDDVAAASAEYKDDSDPIASFLRMCTEPAPDARVQSSHLYELFCAWAKAAGEVEWKQKGFSRALKGKGFTNKASNGMQWLGLRMIRQVREFVDDHGNVVTIAADMGGGGAAQAGDPDPDPGWSAPDDNWTPDF